MHPQLAGGLAGLPLVGSGRSRSINAENPHGEKRKAAMTADSLGPGRKGSPCLRDLAPGAVAVLADIEGPGTINHLWFTVADHTSDADTFVLRDLILRIYWDDEEVPSVECPLGDFFCCGFGRACRVDSLPILVAPTRGFNSYFPMPFAAHARIEVESQHANVIPAFSIRWIIPSGMSPCRIGPDTSMRNGVDRKRRFLGRTMWCLMVYRARVST